jgi:hypothetical protein
MTHTKNTHTETVAKIFKAASIKPENQNMDAEQFVFAL